MGALKTRVGFFCCFLAISFTLYSSSLWAVKNAAIVICAETGRVYHEQNADTVIPPASLTKMMTLYLTFKALREGRITFDQHLPISKRSSLAAPCKLGLKAGSTISVRHAIMGMVTKSANDASIAIAETLGRGSEAHFASLMTQEARRLGMSNTVFRNSHGLPEKQQSVTTARDMATLSRCLYKHFPEYFKFFKEQTFVYKGQVHNNHNHLLGRIPGVDGIKTGFINASGFNLAASMVRGNHRIVAVVLGGESRHARDRKMVRLLETTHARLVGKGRTPQDIEDLICTLAPTEIQATPIKTNVHNAVNRSQCRPAKLIQANYKSVDHLLDTIEAPPSQRRVKKNLPIKKAKIVKKTPCKVSKKAEVKKGRGKKAIKKVKEKK